MKTMLTIVFTVLLSVTTSWAQDTQFKVTGNFTGMEDSSYLFFHEAIKSTIRITDTILVLDGKFTFERDLTESPIYVYLSGEDWEPKIRFWGEKDSIHIEGDYADLANSKIFDSEINRVNKILETEFYNEERILPLAREYANTYPGLHVISALKDKFPPEELEEIYTGLPENLKEHINGVTLKTYLSARKVKTPEIGDNIVDFEAFDPEGKTYKLSELNDRYVILEFGAAPCMGCIAAAPELAKLQADEKENLNVVSFSIDMYEANWRWGVNFINSKFEEGEILHLWDGKGDSGPIPVWYNVKGIPLFYMIDPDGKVIDKWVGYSEGMMVEKWEKIKANE